MLLVECEKFFFWKRKSAGRSSTGLERGAKRLAHRDSGGTFGLFGLMPADSKARRKPGTAYITESLVLRLSGVQQMKSVRELDLRGARLGGHRIRRIEGLDKCAALERLDLSGNLISRIENLRGLRELRELNLSGNAIDRLEHVSEIEKLQILRLASNSIASIPGSVRRCEQLRHLDLSNNKISTLEDVARLARVPHLQTLVLKGNPVAELHNYRAYCAYRLPLLFSLDGRAIEWDERRMAREQFHSKELDAVERRCGELRDKHAQAERRAAEAAQELVNSERGENSLRQQLERRAEENETLRASRRVLEQKLSGTSEALQRSLAEISELRQTFAHYQIDNTWWNLGAAARRHQTPARRGHGAAGGDPSASAPPSAPNTGNPFASGPGAARPRTRKRAGAPLSVSFNLSPRPGKGSGADGTPAKAAAGAAPINTASPARGGSGEANMLAHDFLLAMIQEGLEAHADEYDRECKRVELNIQELERSAADADAMRRASPPASAPRGLMSRGGSPSSQRQREAELERLLRRESDLGAELGAMERTFQESGESEHERTAEELRAELRVTRDALAATKAGIMPQQQDAMGSAAGPSSPGLTDAQRTPAPAKKRSAAAGKAKGRAAVLRSKLKLLVRLRDSLRGRVKAIGAQRDVVARSLGRPHEKPKFKPGMPVPEPLLQVPPELVFNITAQAAVAASVGNHIDLAEWLPAHRRDTDLLAKSPAGGSELEELFSPRKPGAAKESALEARLIDERVAEARKGLDEAVRNALESEKTRKLRLRVEEQAREMDEMRQSLERERGVRRDRMRATQAELKTAREALGRLESERFGRSGDSKKGTAPRESDVFRSQREQISALRDAIDRAVFRVDACTDRMLESVGESSLGRRGDGDSENQGFLEDPGQVVGAVARLEGASRRLLSRLEELQKSNEACEAEWRTAREKLEDSVAELQDRMQAEQQGAATKSEALAGELRAVRAELAASKERCDKLTGDASAASARADRAAEDLRKFHSAAQQERLSAQEEDARRERRWEERLRGFREEIEAQEARSAQLAAQVAAREEEARAARADLHGVRESLAFAQRQVEQRQAEVKRLEGAIQAYRRDPGSYVASIAGGREQRFVAGKAAAATGLKALLSRGKERDARLAAAEEQLREVDIDGDSKLPHAAQDRPRARHKPRRPKKKKRFKASATEQALGSARDKGAASGGALATRVLSDLGRVEGEIRKRAAETLESVKIQLLERRAELKAVTRELATRREEHTRLASITREARKRTVEDQRRADEVRAELQRLERAFSKSRAEAEAEAARAKEADSALRAAREGLAAQVADVKRDLKELEETKIRLQAEVIRLQKEGIARGELHELGVQAQAQRGVLAKLADARAELTEVRQQAQAEATARDRAIAKSANAAAAARSAEAERDAAERDLERLRADAEGAEERRAAATDQAAALAKQSARIQQQQQLAQRHVDELTLTFERKRVELSARERAAEDALKQKRRQLKLKERLIEDAARKVKAKQAELKAAERESRAGIERAKSARERAAALEKVLENQRGAARDVSENVKRLRREEEACVQRLAESQAQLEGARARLRAMVGEAEAAVESKRKADRDIQDDVKKIKALLEETRAQSEAVGERAISRERQLRAEADERVDGMKRQMAVAVQALRGQLAAKSRELEGAVKFIREVKGQSSLGGGDSSEGASLLDLVKADLNSLSQVAQQLASGGAKAGQTAAQELRVIAHRVEARALRLETVLAAELNAKEEGVAVARRSHDELTKRLQELRQAVQAETGKIKDLRSEASFLAGESSRRRGALAQEEVKLKFLRAERSTLEAAKRELEAVKSDVAAKEAEKVRLDAEAQELRRRIESLRTQAAQASSDSASAQAGTRDARANAAEAESRLKALQEALTAADKRRRAALEAAEDAQKLHERKRRETGVLCEHMRRLVGESQSLAKRVAELEKQERVAAAKKQDAERAAARLAGRVAELQREEAGHQSAAAASKLRGELERGRQAVQELQARAEACARAAQRDEARSAAAAEKARALETQCRHWQGRLEEIRGELRRRAAGGAASQTRSPTSGSALSGAVDRLMVDPVFDGDARGAAEPALRAVLAETQAAVGRVRALLQSLEGLGERSSRQAVVSALSSAVALLRAWKGKLEAYQKSATNATPAPGPAGGDAGANAYIRALRSKLWLLGEAYKADVRELQSVYQGRETVMMARVRGQGAEIRMLHEEFGRFESVMTSSVTDWRDEERLQKRLREHAQGIRRQLEALQHERHVHVDVEQMKLAMKQRDQQITYLANKATRLNSAIQTLNLALEGHVKPSGAATPAAAAPRSPGDKSGLGTPPKE